MTFLKRPKLNFYPLNNLKNKSKAIVLGLLMMVFASSVFAQGDHISLGVGPALLYSDNSGIFREFKFKVQPTATISYNKQITDFMGLRGSLGVQFMNSGDYYLEKPKNMVKWGDKDQAYSFTGQGYFADVMPMFTTNPNSSGMLTSAIQFYAGAGFGVMFVQREEQILKNGEVSFNQLVKGETITTDDSDIIPYVPVRTGISTNLSGDWDFALEFVLLITTNSEVDGNNILDKRITKVDMAGQILLTVKRYIGSPW